MSAPAAALLAASRAVVITPPSTSLYAWWGADDAYTETSGTPTTLISADGTAIGSLKDKSGNSRHLYQTSGPAKATFKTAIIGGKSIARGTAATSMRTTAGAIPAGDVTIYVVFKSTTWSTGTAIVGTNNDTPSFLLNQTTSSPSLKLYRNNGFGSVLSPADGANSLVAAALPTSGSTVARLNAGADVTGTSGTLTGGSNMTMFEYGTSVGPGFIGDIAEVLVYSTNHATAGLGVGDGLQARQYLDQKYSLGLGL